jgi:hypothetical protein
MEISTEIWLPLSTLIIGTLLGAAVAVQKAKSITRWQAKFESYRRVLEAVEDMRYWAEQVYAHSLMLPSAGGEELGRLHGEYQRAKRELWGNVRAGGLLISARAQEVLEALLQEVAGEEIRFDQDRTGDHQAFDAELAEHADAIRKASSDTLPKLVRIARADVR